MTIRIQYINAGTARNFSLREVIPTDESEVRKARTFTIPLQHNSVSSLLTMGGVSLILIAAS